MTRVIGTIADPLSTDIGHIVGYTVFKDGVPLTPTTSLTTYDVSGLSPSTTYSFAVQGFDAQGRSTPLSTAIQVTTPANAAPVWQSIPAQLPIVGNAYQLVLTNYCSDADLDALTFAITSGTLPGGLILSGSTIQGTPTTAGQTPTVGVQASDVFHQVGTSISFSTKTADVTAPPLPTGITATAVSTSQINVAWNATTDTAGTSNEFVSGTKDYRVYRSTDGSTYSLRTTVVGTSYSDTGLSASTTYYYRIAVRDNALNESAQASAVSATTQSASSALADWNARSTAAGVVTAIRPNSTTIVDQYRKTEPDGSQSNVVLDPLDGIIGDGCCKIYVNAATGSSSGDLMIPFNPAWTGSQGPGTQDYYIQFRCKLGPNRLIPANGDQTGGAHGEYVNCSGGFKICIIGGYNPTSPGSTVSDTDNELVITNPGWLQIPVAYNHSSGQNVQRFQEPVGGYTSQQPAVDRGSSFTDGNRYCLYHAPPDTSSAVSPGCWFFQENQWVTFYVHFKYNSPGGSAGNRLELYVARDGEFSYTKLFDETNFAWASGAGDPNDAPNGPRGLHLLPYDSHRTSSSVDTWHKYDEIIISTQPIACPQVVSANTLPTWAQALSDKVWSTPTDNATANAAGTAWPGGSAVIDPLAASNSGTSGGHHSIVDAYCGAAADQSTNEYGLPAAGGHSDYWGNEVYVLQLRNNIPQWQRVTNADLHEGSSGSIGAWSTGRPTPCHLYSNHIGAGGVYYAFGRSAVPYNGFADNNPRVWTFTRSSNTWSDKGNLISPAAPYDGNQIVFYDRLNDQFIVILGGNASPGVRIYNRGNLSLASTANASLNDGGELTGSFDSTNRIIVVRGNGGGAGTNGYFWMKLSAPTVWNNLTVTGTGPVYKDGFAWHWPSRAYLGFVEGVGLVKGTPTVNSSGNYTALAWTTVPGTSGLTPPNANRVSGAGTYNRLQLFEDLGGGRSVIVYNPTYTNPSPYIMRLPLAGV